MADATRTALQPNRLDSERILTGFSRDEKELVAAIIRLNFPKTKSYFVVVRILTELSRNNPFL